MLLAAFRPSNGAGERDSDPQFTGTYRRGVMGLVGGAASGVYFWWFPRAKRFEE